MVREWGMSDRIGPMAWGSQGQVFLGEDLVHTRDYSDETARVIDEEVERILRDAGGPVPASCSPSTVAASTSSRSALLERETIEGADVSRLVQQGLEEESPEEESAEPVAEPDAEPTDAEPTPVPSD